MEFIYLLILIHNIIGKFQVFDVLISMGGDVIFLLELPAVYDQSVQLFIKYTDDNNSSRSYNRTTEIGFLNSKSIQYVEYSSQVSYDRFRVKAGLVSGGMLGPLTEAPGVYGMTCNIIITLIVLRVIKWLPWYSDSAGN